MRISLVVAMAPDGLIGRAGALPWHLPADLRRFRWLSNGRPLLMGRRTYDSLQLRPLPYRHNIVLSRRRAGPQGCTLARSLPEALQLARDWLTAPEGPAWRRPGMELMVIGGAGLYRDTLDRAGRIYLTRVLHRCNGDTWFPELDPAQWEERSAGGQPADDRNPYAMRFSVLERRRNAGEEGA